MKSIFLWTLLSSALGGWALAQPANETTTPAAVELPTLFVPMSLRHLREPDPTVRAIVRVGEQGQIVDLLFTDADHLALVRVAKNALREARFTPATRDGKPVMSDLDLEIHFNNPAMDLGGSVGMTPGEDIAETIASISDPKSRLAPANPRELDAPLTLVEQGETMVPVDDQDNPLSGRAVLEFWVGQEGHPHLIRILSSDHPAIAKAALYMLKGSRFEPPQREGHPTVVKVRMPFAFD